MARHSDKTNSATIRRYRLMGVSAVFRRIHRDIVESLRNDEYSDDREERGESAFYPLIAGYSLSEKENKAWTSVLYCGFERGLRAAFDEHNRHIPTLLPSCAVNPYKIGRRDQFVSDTVKDCKEEILPTVQETVDLRRKQFAKDLSIDLADTLREARRIGLSPMEVERSLRVCLAGALELAQTLIYEVICLAYDVGRARGQQVLRGLA